MILKAEVLGSAHPLPQGIITLRDYRFRRLKNIVVLFVKISDKSAAPPPLSKKMLRACSRVEMNM